jgi:hypothetical protein
MSDTRGDTGNELFVAVDDTNLDGLPADPADLTRCVSLM